MHWKMSVHQVWHFMHRNLQVHWRIMLHVSLPIDSIEKCIGYANIKVFSEPNFPAYESKDIYKKIQIRENSYICIFYQCDIFHLLSQKITHNWIRIKDNYTEIN